MSTQTDQSPDLSGGWIRAYRSEFYPDDPLGGEPVCRRWAWLDLRSMAAHSGFEKPVGLVLVPLARGELLASVRYLATRWKWSKSRVSRFLDVLERRGKIETLGGTPKHSPAGTVYRVVNYEPDQGARDTSEDPARDSTRNTTEDSSGTAARQRKERKEGKKKLSEPNGSGDGSPGQIVEKSREADPVTPLLGVLRETGWRGGPENRKEEARDVHLLREWLREGRTQESIEFALRGFHGMVEDGMVEWIKPGSRWGVRALQNTQLVREGSLRSALSAAQDYHLSRDSSPSTKREPRSSYPTLLREILRGSAALPDNSAPGGAP